MVTLNALFSRLVLILCLSFYGPLAMAMTSGDGRMMEICADGAVKSVSVDPSGTPIDENDTCDDCLNCCLSSGGVTLVATSADQSSKVCTVTKRLARHRDQFVRNPDIRPMPRGPPALSDIPIIVTDVILPDRNDIRAILRSNGRPDFKGAVE